MNFPNYNINLLKEENEKLKEQNKKLKRLLSRMTTYATIPEDKLGKDLCEECNEILNENKDN